MASNNPFSYGNPVSDPRRFIGRNQEVGQIYSRLRNPEFESSSLVGERRMGKTSLFNYISHPDVVASNGLDTAMYLFVHLDLQMVEPSTTPTRLYQHMCRRISNRTEDPDIKEQLNQVSGLETIDTYDLSDACDVIDQKGVHVVLLMDEFENIAGNANFGPEFYYGLRSLAIHHNLALVTSSQNDLMELSRSDAVRSSPFFNIFATINLQPLATGDVQRLLEGYLSGSDVTFSEAEVRYLWRMSGGNPFLLQMGAFKLYDAYLQERPESHSLPMVHAEFGLGARPHLRTYWEYTSDDEKIVLALMALLETQKERKSSSWAIPQLEELYRRASSVVPPLTRRGLIRKAQDGYRLFSSAFTDSILQEITSPSSEPLSSEEWQQRVGSLLGALPDVLRSRVEHWLTGIDTGSLDLFLKWLSDPRTAEVALEVINNSEARFEEIGILESPGQLASAGAQSVGKLPVPGAPGAGRPGKAAVEEPQADDGSGSDVELIIDPPPPGHMLLSLTQWLERTVKAEIEEMAGSATGGTSVRLYLKRPVPLVDMLSSLEEVESVTQEPAEESEEGKGPRFIKRRKDTRGQTPGALQRYRVVLNPSPAPGEPLAEGEEEALLATISQDAQEQEQEAEVEKEAEEEPSSEQ